LKEERERGNFGYGRWHVEEKEEAGLSGLGFF